MNDKEEKKNEPTFSASDLGNGFLWMGKLLHDLDAAGEGTKCVRLTPDLEANKGLLSEIYDFQSKLQTLTAARKAPAILLRLFLEKHNVESILDSDTIRIIATVFYRQMFILYKDSCPMTIARVASPCKTIEDILRNYKILMSLVKNTVFDFQEGELVRLHGGLEDHFIGNEPAAAQKPPAKQVEKTEEAAQADQAPGAPTATDAQKNAAPAQNQKSPLSFSGFVKAIPVITPMEMAAMIKGEGYIGQDGAVKSLCLTAWRHINRIKKVFVDNIDAKHLPPKANTLLVGKTGCGKTHLVELLFSKVLKLPTLIADTTTLTERGYVGGDAEDFYTRLIQVADKHLSRASVGIICLDEFDKIAAVGSTTRFSGEGSTKDLKLGVQHQLLKLMEASEIFVPMELSHSSNVKRIHFPTTFIPIIGCGAFSGFWRTQNKGTTSIGFGSDCSNPKTNCKEELKKAANFESYGILPELYGRFSSVIIFDELTTAQLKTILKRNTIQQYEKELSLNGLELTVHPDVYEHIVQQCLEKNTGARGLQSALVTHLEDVLFDAYSFSNSKGIRLFVDGGTIRGEVIRRRAKRVVEKEFAVVSQ